VNRVVFTSTKDIEELTDLDPSCIYIGQVDQIRFAFSSRAMLYRQSGLFHYRGDAIYPEMATQVIDKVSSLDTRNVIVSNSLPIWLAMGLPLSVFPSFAVDDNITPPWAAVHIPEEGTTALQAAPYIDDDGSHWQLARDRVRLTVYGLRNYQAQDLVDQVLTYSVNTDLLGIMNMPIVRDAKRTQPELGILAQKKTVEFEVSYYQNRVRDVALQYITQCVPTFMFEGGVSPSLPVTGQVAELDFSNPANSGLIGH
jgi:hypothetical protein